MPDWGGDPETVQEYLPHSEWPLTFTDTDPDLLHEEIQDLRGFCNAINESIIYNHGQGIGYYDTITGKIVAEELRVRHGNIS